jgi:hypothetical protein
MYNKIDWDAKHLALLKKLYEQAVRNDVKKFDFMGNTLTTLFTKYLIEYLETLNLPK